MVQSTYACAMQTSALPCLRVADWELTNQAHSIVMHASASGIPQQKSLTLMQRMALKPRSTHYTAINTERSWTHLRIGELTEHGQSYD